MRRCEQCACSKISQHIATTVKDLTQQGDVLLEAVGRFKLNEAETFELEDDAE